MYCVVVGARPNFVKAAALVRALRVNGVSFLLVHTGQHYDRAMSEVFFRDLDLPPPAFNLAVGEQPSRGKRFHEIVNRFENVCREIRFDGVLVLGDVDSTHACAVAASQLGLKLGHVEAGARSFNDAMPEERNRVAVDRLSDVLFCSWPENKMQLIREGIDARRAHVVGDLMIDTLLRHRSRLRPWRRDRYAVLTLHRQANVDDPGRLAAILKAMRWIEAKVPVMFCCHPRTRARIREFGYEVDVVSPLGYLDFLRLVNGAALVLTDSGGLQTETTVLGVPCITLRDETEHVRTITHGTNWLAGTDEREIVERAERVLDCGIPPPKCYWHEGAAEQVAEIFTGRGR